jgi:hypothetical protein
MTLSKNQLYLWMQSLVRLFAGLTQRTASFHNDDSTQRTASFELSKKISAWAGF